MRSAFSAMLFLAMVPLGSMATEVRTGGHMASNVQGTALEEAQDQRLQRRGISRRGRVGERRGDGHDDSNDSSNAPSPTAGLSMSSGPTAGLSMPSGPTVTADVLMSEPWPAPTRPTAGLSMPSRPTVTADVLMSEPWPASTGLTTGLSMPSRPTVTADVLMSEPSPASTTGLSMPPRPTVTADVLMSDPSPGSNGPTAGLSMPSGPTYGLSMPSRPTVTADVLMSQPSPASTGPTAGLSMSSGPAATTAVLISEPSPAPTADGDMELLLELHNEARCLHNADDLTYSDEVATYATAHATVLSSDCGGFYHSEREDRNGYGENLYLCLGSTSCYSPDEAMQSLYEEEVQFDTVAEYGLHATQILWKSTTELGCAVQTCELESVPYTYLVCQYSPAGNNLANLEDEVDLLTDNTC